MPEPVVPAAFRVCSATGATSIKEQMNEKIEGGFYLKARVIQKSEIAHQPPHVRETWDLLLLLSNHCDVKKNGRIFRRGQCITSYQELQEQLSWAIGWRKCRYSKGQIEQAMKFLRKGSIITTQKTTRGLLITITNYERYQDPKNYESHTEHHNESHNDTTLKTIMRRKENIYTPISLESYDFSGRLPNQVEAIKYFCTRINGEFTRVLQFEQPLTIEGLIKLIEGYGITRVEEIFSAMENKDESYWKSKHYKSAFRTAINWLKRPSK